MAYRLVIHGYRDTRRQAGHATRPHERTHGQGRLVYSVLRVAIVGALATAWLWVIWHYSQIQMVPTVTANISCPAAWCAQGR